MLRMHSARSILWLTGILLVVAVCVACYRVWDGEPYPATDPDQVAARLKQEAQHVYDEVALPGPPDVSSSGVETGTCYYRGLRSVAHIDQGRRDVRDFRLEWWVTDITKDTARVGQERVRRRLEQEGWKLTSENISDMGFRFERPDTDFMVDVDWYQPTGTLAVSVYAPCGKLPDGFDEYELPESDWSPK
ncbi:hypothetical protein F0344_14600 [Streptomyces finlayi]|uniref:DUF4853 domain-containing protein n=1 Tax=Streptomyces finlayi TaxID=67296 RepID=A0A7G7BK30_9ACTN|nr:hypothetical protein [Streptomyces finlayi]QNE75695.1 hypothetical protein F0344_14600 [Streptomyces finlayi]